jgi:hypothetical protein
MSAETTLYGCIIAHGPVGPEMEHFYKVNQQVIETLPRSVSPGSYQLQRGFFTVPFREPWGFYRSQMIHFGASYNHFEAGWPEWLDAFERLLASLFWEKAFLHLESEYFGRQDYQWIADVSPMLEAPPRPIKKWKFEGGMRAFPI